MMNGVLNTKLADVTTENEPVILADVKAYCKIDFDEEDDLITSFISVARGILEDYCNISFIQREIQAVIINECGGQLLPYGPISDVESIVVKDSDGNTVSDFKTTGIDFINLENPISCDLTVTYQGGYEAGKLPPELKTAIKAQVLYMYEHRGDETDAALNNIAPVAKQLCQRKRMVLNEWFI